MTTLIMAKLSYTFFSVFMGTVPLRRKYYITPLKRTDAISIQYTGITALALKVA
jgi:hypothetical protein